MNIATFFRQIGIGGVLNTLYINFKTMPLSKAIKLPIISGKNIKFKNLHRGCIICHGSFACVRIGVDGGSWEMNSGKLSVLSFWEKGLLVCDGFTNICSSFVVNIAGTVHLGDNFCSNTGFLLSCEKGIFFGKNVLLGWNVTMIDGDGHKILQNGTKINYAKDIRIDDHCWFAANVTILKGVHLLANTVVPMGSVVTKSCSSSNCIYGVSNKVIKDNINWEK